ncbi:MAG: hypothetical protein PHI37_02990 [Candidatus Gracilibacteria bacterium]|nr:hypothetical protein [Candidatus Gracilibacteria bacterium]
MNETNFITQKKSDLYRPLVFLGIVLILTVCLFLYNWGLERSVSGLNEKISQRIIDIENLKNDPKVQVYSLIENNKNTIDILEKRSRITDYVKHLNAISKKYDLLFEGFDLNQGKLNLQVIVNSSEKGIAYIKARDFIKNYRLEDNALFDLGFINSIEGSDFLKFNVEFSIK